MQPETPDRQEFFSSLPAPDLSFLHRVYRTSAVLTFAGGIFVATRFGWSPALGFMIGAAISVLSLLTVEWTVRRYVASGGAAGRSVAATFMLKLPAIAGLLLLAGLAGKRGWVSLLWIVPGFALPHAVIVLKLLGRWLLAWNSKSSKGGPTDPPRRR
jgi:hypothetical protein